MCTRSEPTTVIGLMSGTSHDAIDAAAARLWSEDDTLVLQPLGLISEPYPAALRDQIAAALPPASTTMKAVCRLDTGIGHAFRSEEHTSELQSRGRLVRRPLREKETGEAR